MKYPSAGRGQALGTWQLPLRRGAPRDDWKCWQRRKIMSTDFRPLKHIAATDMFDGRLEAFGVREHFNVDTTDTSRMLTDGRNYLWVYVRDDLVAAFTRYAPNGSPGKILSAIAEAFDVDIVSEYEPQFWGFDTEEEWQAAEAAIAKEYDEQFFAEILKYLK